MNVVASKYIPGYAAVYDGPWVESVTGEAIAELFEGSQPWALETIRVRLYCAPATWMADHRSYW